MVIADDLVQWAPGYELLLCCHICYMYTFIPTSRSPMINILSQLYRDVIFHVFHHLSYFQDPLADPWILPMIQGYVQIELCDLDLDDPDDASEILNRRSPSPIPKEPITFNITLISRRCRYRAGGYIKLFVFLWWWYDMAMLFHITGTLWGESTSNWWIPLTQGQ